MIVLFHLLSPKDRKTMVPPNMRHLKCTRAQFKNLVRLCNCEQFRSDEALQEIKSPILGLNELHSLSLIFLIERWRHLFSKVTTTSNNRSTPQTLNIIELSTMGEKVVSESITYMQRVMKVRHDTVADLRDHGELVKEQFSKKLNSK